MNDVPTSHADIPSGGTLLEVLAKSLPDASTGPATDGFGGFEIAVQYPQLEIAHRLLDDRGYRIIASAPGRRTYMIRTNGAWDRVVVSVNGRVPAWARLRKRRIRSSGLVIALVGPDGAGKGTVSASLSDGHLPLVIRQMYFGSGGTTPSSAGNDGPILRTHKTPPSAFRETAFVIWKLVKAARLLISAHSAARRGEIAVCDRHPIELRAIQPRRRSRLAALVQRWGVRLLPDPDTIIVMDAPGQILFDRKGEHSPAQLESWREAFRTRLAGPRTTIISSLQDLDATATAARDVVWEGLAVRNRW